MRHDSTRGHSLPSCKDEMRHDLYRYPNSTPIPEIIAAAKAAVKTPKVVKDMKNI